MASGSLSGLGVITSFAARTRELYECVCCTKFLKDPFEIECGHFLCTPCSNQLSAMDEPCCAVCKLPILKSHLVQPNVKKSTLISALQQFLQDFCQDEQLLLESILSSSQLQSKQNSSPLHPVVLQEQQKIYPEPKKTPSPSVVLHRIPSESPIEKPVAAGPQSKVSQWLLDNVEVVPSVVENSQENSENAQTTRRSSGRISRSSSKRKSSPLSSAMGRDSYDIVSAPSPPPSHDEFPQTKRGRGSRRGRQPRKNALPISSGESSAKKRGRQSGKTPPTKETNTPGQTPSPAQETFSQSLMTNSSMSFTPVLPISSMSTPVEKSFSHGKSNGSLQNGLNGGDESLLSKQSGSADVQAESTRISVDVSDKQSTVSQQTQVTEQFTPALAKPTEPLEEVVEQPSIPVEYPTAPSPLLEKVLPLTAQHVTPVARPKTRNSYSPVKILQNKISETRRHSLKEGFINTHEKRTVSFFHKGRIVPRTPTSLFRKQPIAFVCLGKLRREGTKVSTEPIVVLADKSSASQNTIPEKSVEMKEVQTVTTQWVTVATQTEDNKLLDGLEKENRAPTDSLMPTSQLLFHSLPSVASTAKEPAKNQEVVTVEPDECSEDAFLFAEPFKRARVLSSSESESEQTESKRRKNSNPKDEAALPDPPRLPPSKPTQPVSQGAAAVVKQVSPSNQDAGSKTMVAESDPDSDVDIVAPTPPKPPPPRAVIVPRKIFVCSGLPRNQVKIVDNWAQQIGAEVLSTFSPSVSHVIVQVDEDNCAQRTLKFLFGVASGKWIVGVDWVHTSIREGKPVDEEPFEALDMDGEQGPRRSRLRNHSNRLFQAFEFCCQEPFTDVTLDQLRELLELCGASTVSNPSELTKKRRHAMIIVQTDDDVGLEVQRKAVNWFDRLQVLSVSREWVLDCLASYQLLPIRNQLIGKHSESLLKMMGFDALLLA